MLASAYFRPHPTARRELATFHARNPITELLDTRLPSTGSAVKRHTCAGLVFVKNGKEAACARRRLKGKEAACARRRQLLQCSSRCLQAIRLQPVDAYAHTYRCTNTGVLNLLMIPDPQSIFQYGPIPPSLDCRNNYYQSYYLPVSSKYFNRLNLLYFRYGLLGIENEKKAISIDLLYFF